MIGDYPPRLSVDELRHELAAYGEYRHSRGIAKKTIGQEFSVIGRFLYWLETGAVPDNVQPSIPEVVAVWERI